MEPGARGGAELAKCITGISDEPDMSELSAPTRPAILVVEDSKTTKALLIRHLGDSYRTIEAEDGEEAWETLQRHPEIELIITDINMPRLSGQQLLERIRATTDERVRALPVIVLTAADESADKTRAFASGANDFISKPVDPLELQARVAVHHKLARTIHELEQSRRALSELAATDSLTGLKNRRTFFESCGDALNAAERYQNDLSLLFIDVDHFKRINDTYGHPAGDQVLAHIARLLVDTLRGGDIVGRIGGEEFAVLLPNANPTTSTTIAERLRRTIEAEPMAIEGAPLHTTVSIGLAHFRLDAGHTPDALLAIADRRVYAAKRAGRNRVCGEDPAG